MADQEYGRGSAAQQFTVQEVKSVNADQTTFDGQKADVYLNTGQLGRHFLVRVANASGKPTLIALHL